MCSGNEFHAAGTFRDEKAESFAGAWDHFFNRREGLKVNNQFLSRADQQLSCHSAAASRGPCIKIQGPRDVAELTTGHYYLCYAVYVNAGTWSRQVVIAVTFTPVRHKRRMQFLNPSPKFWAGSQLAP